MKRVKVTSPKSKYFDRTGTVTFVYYDAWHTGESPDLLHIQLDNGPKIQCLSTHVQEEPTDE